MDTSKSIKPKILVIVGHALYEPWTSILYQGQLRTWVVNQNVLIYHTHANPISNHIRQIDAFFWKMKWHSRFGKYFTFIELVLKFPFRAKKGSLSETYLPETHEKSLTLDMPDLDMVMNFKSFGIITGTLAFDYDYLVSTTTSSYLNIIELEKKILMLPRSKVVSGRIIEQDSVTFASGSFRVFSRDVVEGFLKHRKRFSTWRPEDQAFGFLIKDSGMDVEYVNMDSIDISSLASLNNLSKEDLSRVVHFRLKSGTLESRNDVEIMLKLHKMLGGTISARE
jgi:hypothetical protein